MFIPAEMLTNPEENGLFKVTSSGGVAIDRFAIP